MQNHYALAHTTRYKRRGNKIDIIRFRYDILYPLRESRSFSELSPCSSGVMSTRALKMSSFCCFSLVAENR